MHNLFIIYLTGMLGIQKAIPLGIMLNTPPPSICLMTILGASTMVIMIYVLSSRIRQFVLKKMNKNRLNKKKMKTNKLVTKYGVIGLGLLGTVIMGPHITMLMGLLVVNEKTKLLVWIIIGILLWATILTAVAALCFELFERSVFFSDFISISKQL